MRIVFFGTPELAVPTLAAVSDEHEVIAVVCQPDKAKGRSKKLIAPPAKQWADAHKIPVHQPTKLNDGAFEAWLTALAPDVCVVAAYGRLLKQPLLDIPRYGYLNVHPSLLPRWRGPSPIQSAVLAGDSETGVSIMRLVLEMDAGDVQAQERIAIGPDENAAQLTAHLAAIGAGMMLDALREVQDGTATYVPQDPALVTHCNLITKDDGKIDWTRPAAEIHNQVRGCQPWPVAYCDFHGGPLRIHRSQVIAGAATQAPGVVSAVEKDHLRVATGEGELALLELQAPGKRAMACGDFLRGNAVAVGEQLGASD